MENIENILVNHTSETPIVLEYQGKKFEFCYYKYSSSDNFIHSISKKGTHGMNAMNVDKIDAGVIYLYDYNTFGGRTEFELNVKDITIV